MQEITLIRPSINYSKEIIDFRNEILSSTDDDKFAGCSSLKNHASPDEWISFLSRMENAETCPQNLVPSTTYIAIRNNDKKVVGIIEIRHHINNPVLKSRGGHIGYSVRPSERGKGYGKKMLRLALPFCKAINIDKVLITCKKENRASENIILNNGGIFESEITVDGIIVKRFWIHLQ